MTPAEVRQRLDGAEQPPGDESRYLVLAAGSFALHGLDAALASSLARRWGRFLRRAAPGPPLLSVELRRAGPGPWLRLPPGGECYRIEAVEGSPGGAVSYHFALARSGSTFRLALSDDPGEPGERVVENALRLLVARAITEGGGLALHAAGVLHRGRAYLFAGPSRAGKTTAVGLSAPALSLGDDFGIAVPAAQGYCAAAVPFDNAERIEHDPPRELLPLAGVFRLHQARETRIERPPTDRAVASLMGCTAFPWAMPDLAESLLGQVERLVAAGLFSHLHFSLEPGLLDRLA